MDTWLVCVGAFVGLVSALAGWVVWIRWSHQRHRAALRQAIVGYAAKRGGLVEMDADGNGFHVRGPLGSGRERMTGLDVMCKPGEEARWETSIGFVLRKYIPDAFDEAFAKAAREQLEKLGPEIARLSDDELRARLRVRIVHARTSSEGLATCAVPIGEGYEARVVLDGYDLDGLPRGARARLPGGDRELFAQALDATLPSAPPAPEPGTADTLVWLARPEAIFGSAPHLIAAVGETLAWTAVIPGDVEPRLLDLCDRSGERGPMKNVLWAWDGAKLTRCPLIVHTIIGPTTPDYTLTVPASFHAPLGIHPAADGTFGIRRGGRSA